MLRYTSFIVSRQIGKWEIKRNKEKKGKKKKNEKKRRKKGKMGIEGEEGKRKKNMNHEFAVSSFKRNVE